MTSYLIRRFVRKTIDDDAFQMVDDELLEGGHGHSHGHGHGHDHDHDHDHGPSEKERQDKALK